MTILAFANAVLSLLLTVYGLYSLILAVLYLRRPRVEDTAAAIDRAALPAVAVQAPVYNEQHVVERLIDALAAIDYPRDRLEIQQLTIQLCAAFDISHYHSQMMQSRTAHFFSSFFTTLAGLPATRV